MSVVFRQTQLYKFLLFCNRNTMEKVVLDCGAGGDCPPLALFKEHGYKTFGIEMSDSQIQKSEIFSQDHDISLNIIKGDIRNLPFNDESMSYVYSFNTIFHMKKEDIAKAVSEIRRVLKPGGICFINFLSTDDEDYGNGVKVEEGSYMQMEDDQEVIHTYYKDNEAEEHFEGMKIIYKEKRILEREYEGEKIRQGYIDYIVEKQM